MYCVVHSVLFFSIMYFKKMKYIIYIVFFWVDSKGVKKRALSHLVFEPGRAWERLFWQLFFADNKKKLNSQSHNTLKNIGKSYARVKRFVQTEIFLSEF